MFRCFSVFFQMSCYKIIRESSWYVDKLLKLLLLMILDFFSTSDYYSLVEFWFVSYFDDR